MFLFIFLALFLTSPLSFGDECFNEDCKGVGTFENSKIGKALDPDGAGLGKALKSKEELDEYFACHISTGLPQSIKREREVHLSEFNSLYKPMIELGAQHFQMPYALTACVMFRESRFDRNTPPSSKGAKGIAQFTRETYVTLRRDIENVLEMENGYQEYLKLGYDKMIKYEGNNKYLRCIQYLQGEGILNRQTSAVESKKSKNNCSEQITNHARYKPIYDNMTTYLYDVNRFYRNQKSRRLKSIFPNTPLGHRPKGNDLLPPEKFEDMLKEPAWVVAMNMFYLKQKMINTNAEVDISKFDPSDDMIGYLATIGGSYNRGPAELIAAANGDKPSIKKWCQRMASLPETRDYMLSIRRCMTSNSFDPPAGQANNPSCQGQMTPSTDDPCVPQGGNSTPTQSPFAPKKSLRPRARQ